MKISTKIAWRYIAPKGGVNLVNTLTIISIAGVSIGVALLIIVMSVFNGFFEVVEGILTTWDPDIRIEKNESDFFRKTSELDSLILSIPEIAESSPYVEGKCLLAHQKSRDKVVIVKGVDSKHFFQLNNIEHHIEAGSSNLGFSNGRAGLMVGQRLQFDLGLQLNEQVGLLSANGMKRALTHFSGPRGIKFDIRGIFNMKQVFEGSVVFIDIRAAQHLFETKGEISGLDLRLNDKSKSDKIAAVLKEKLGDEFEVKTWYDIQKPIYDVMKLEKWASFGFLMIVVIVAVLNILGSLTMIVLQKRKDVGILRTMGLTQKDIQKVFITQGWIIGMLGCGIGLSVGLIGSILQAKYKIVGLSSAFMIDAYPISIQLSDIIIVCLGALFCCVLASIWPAKIAVQHEINENLRA